MNKQTNTDVFVHHLDESLLSLMRFTEQFCYNTLFKNVVFIVDPSGTEYHAGMDDFARRNLDRMLRYANKRISKNTLVSLLCVDGYIPNWVNICVDQSVFGKTVVRVMPTREWRTLTSALHELPEREIFHATVSIPAGIDMHSENFIKYDVNLFRRQADLKSGGAWSRLKWFVKMLW